MNKTEYSKIQDTFRVDGFILENPPPKKAMLGTKLEDRRIGR